MGGVGASVYVVAPKIIASAPVPFGPFGPFWGWNWVGLGWDWVWGDWGPRGWGLGLDNFLISSGGEAEDVLNVLRNAGIGHDFESTIR